MPESRKKNKNKNKNKGMSSNSTPPAPPNNTPLLPNEQATCTSEVLGQSRNILYGQDNVRSSSPSFVCQENMNFVQNGVMQSSVNAGPLHNQPCFNTSGTQQITGQLGVHMNTNSGSNNGMPSWAASMCSQLQTIQNQLETQNQRWQTVENQLQGQNVRMSNIEAQINELSNLNRKVAETTRTVENINKEVNSMKSKINDYEQSVQFYNNICDSILNSNTDLKDRVLSVEQAQATNDEKLVDLQWRNMRENLIFSGIPESQLGRGEYEDCESLIKCFIREQMSVTKEVEFDRVHRIGRFRQDQRYPRPIVAKFTYYKDKEIVRQAAPRTLLGTNYSVNEQFPAEIEDRRKRLYPVAKNARRDPNNRVRLVRDKLFINGKQYDHGATNNQTQSQPQQIHREQNRQGQNSQFRQPNFNRNAQTQQTNKRNISVRTDKPFLIGRQFTRQKQTALSNKARPIFNNQSEQTSRDDVIIGASGGSVNAQVRDSNFAPEVYTSNRFLVLSNDAGGDQTPATQFSGKKKATSPLDVDITLKKQKEYDPDSDSVNSNEQAESCDDVCSPGMEIVNSDD